MSLRQEIKEISSRKQEILDAAQQLFSEKGFVAASMRDLATALGIRPASLYSHYKSKDEILWEIAIRAAQNFYERVDPILASETPPLPKLDAMMQAHTQAMIANIDASAIFFTEWKRLEDEKRQQFAEIIATYEGKFIGVLKAGMTQGVFRNGDPRFLTSMLLSTVNWMPTWYRPDGKMSPADIAQASANFVLKGLEA
jgi:AcrR family transcriptional regulator